jgi:carbonic anhydrase
MSELPKLLVANKRYARTFKHAGLPITPTRKLAIVTCQDSRLSVEDFLGLSMGDAHIIRNAGAQVTEDVIRSLIISHEVVGTREFLVIGHTGCGMLAFKDRELQSKLSKKYQHDASGIVFHTFTDVEENLKDQVRKIESSPFLKGVPVSGLVYDVKTGRLRKVV